ncbi:MAG: AAA family ATPase [Ruminococcus sp.]|nr:AAA family ATPase [Ruminococcus sp.]
MLPEGFKLTTEDREYTVISLIGRGANTAAYLALCSCGGLVSNCILKEYAPRDDEHFEDGKARFIAAARLQNELRQRTALTNQTPPVSRIFEANETAYCDVVCFGGTTLNRLDDLSLLQYIELCATVAKTVGCYHKAGYLCLDLKPENIFVMQNSEDDIITQLVELIDFDSVREVGYVGSDGVISYTREWAAPEQTGSFAPQRIGKAADIFTLGELVFFLLFGRHSTDREHRGFSKYPFDETPKNFRRYTDRPDIRSLFSRLFRGTIRSSASNRFAGMDEVVKLLEALADELRRRDYVIPKLPAVSPNFVGRDKELEALAESLKKSRTVFVTGIGGIGKSTLVKNFIDRSRESYDVIVYLEFDGDFVRTFCDDRQLQLSTITRLDSESAEEYFERKLTHFERICGNKKVLFVLDNFSGRITKELSRIFDLGYDTVIVTRNQPPKNSFAFIEIGAISDRTELFRLIALDLERPLTKDERTAFAEIIDLVQGHTLVLELIARQIASGRLGIQTALGLIRQHGFSRFSAEKIGNYKDGEEVYDTLRNIVTALFDASSMTAAELAAMKTLSLLDVRGLEAELVERILKLNVETVQNLGQQGWLISDGRVKVHPVIAETMQNHEWLNTPAAKVMEHHKSVIAVYEGTANAEQIMNVIRQAELFTEEHQRHLVKAMLWDMYGSYYDTLQNGAYVAYTEEEQELQDKLIEAMDNAIAEAEQSDDPKRDKYLARYMLSLASILTRSSPTYHHEARELLDKTAKLIPADDAENRCYHCMVSAWYYTLAEPDPDRTKAFTDRAEALAKQVFHTDIELTDIIYIPVANSLFFHNDLTAAAQKLDEAVALCKAHPDQLTYIDKHAELLCCLTDVYAELGDKEKCRELLAELAGTNEKYRDDGIHREPDPDTLERLK